MKLIQKIHSLNSNIKENRMIYHILLSPHLLSNTNPNKTKEFQEAVKNTSIGKRGKLSEYTINSASMTWDKDGEAFNELNTEDFSKAKIYKNKIPKGSIIIGTATKSPFRKGFDVTKDTGIGAKFKKSASLIQDVYDTGVFDPETEQLIEKYMGTINAIQNKKSLKEILNDKDVKNEKVNDKVLRTTIYNLLLAFTRVAPAISSISTFENPEDYKGSVHLYLGNKHRGSFILIPKDKTSQVDNKFDDSIEPYMSSRSKQPKSKKLKKSKENSNKDEIFNEEKAKQVVEADLEKKINRLIEKVEKLLTILIEKIEELAKQGNIQIPEGILYPNPQTSRPESNPTRKPKQTSKLDRKIKRLNDLHHEMEKAKQAGGIFEAILRSDEKQYQKEIKKLTGDIKKDYAKLKMLEITTKNPKLKKDLYYIQQRLQDIEGIKHGTFGKEIQRGLTTKEGLNDSWEFFKVYSESVAKGAANGIIEMVNPNTYIKLTKLVGNVAASLIFQDDNMEKIENIIKQMGDTWESANEKDKARILGTIMGGILADKGVGTLGGMAKKGNKMAKLADKLPNKIKKKLKAARKKVEAARTKVKEKTKPVKPAIEGGKAAIEVIKTGDQTSQTVLKKGK